MKKVSGKIKVWARIGQLSFWLYQFSYMLWNNQYHIFESAGKTAQQLSIVCMVFAVLISEAIVRLIGYFAELFDK